MTKLKSLSHLHAEVITNKVEFFIRKTRQKRGLNTKMQQLILYVDQLSLS